ncbi:MAG TPA: hypothetical protein DCS55_16320 [Acidimicrobiaceae bacterium]|nr:hypothetical protein [Acidimicrobiaceae bacterium]
MLSSIHPLGERGKGNRFGVTAGAFLVGSLLGGASTGTIAALVSIPVDALVSTTAATATIALVAVAAAAFERTGRSLPSVPRQVDENWLNEYRGWVYGAGFGFQLGAGVLTYITTAAVYVALAAAVLAGHPLAALGIMVAFGITRGLTLLPARSIASPQRLVEFHQRLHRWSPAVRTTSTSVLAASALFAGAALLI